MTTHKASFPRGRPPSRLPGVVGLEVLDGRVQALFDVLVVIAGGVDLLEELGLGALHELAAGGRVVEEIVHLDRGPRRMRDRDLPTRLVGEGWLAHYLDFAGERMLPPMPKLLEAPFWLDPSDPHRIRAAMQLLTWPQSRSYVALTGDWRHSKVEMDVGPKAVHRVATVELTPEQAVDEEEAAKQAEAGGFLMVDAPVSGGNSVLSELSNEDLTCDMEDAIRLNACGITLSIYVGAEHEHQTLVNLGKLADWGNKNGVPVMAVTAVGRDMARDARYLGLASRMAAEIGAHMVKTYYCENFEMVTTTCPVPIAILKAAEAAASGLHREGDG